MDLYAYVIACTGWTWADVDRLTIAHYLALARYWQKSPPVHVLVAAYMGYKAPESAQDTEKRVASPENENAALELMRALSPT